MIITIFNIDVTGNQTPLDTYYNLTAAHIHGQAAIGSSIGVIWGFFGTPDNDNNPDSTTLTPFPGGVGGTFFTVWNAPEGQNTTLTAQLNNILNGLTYSTSARVRTAAARFVGRSSSLSRPRPRSSRQAFLARPRVSGRAADGEQGKLAFPGIRQLE